MKKLTAMIIALVMVMTVLVGCGEATPSKTDTEATLQVADTLQGNQPTPTDISYSLERFNLIRRAYWVNGQREKAMSLTVPIERPLGYIVLLADSGAVVGNFIVDGKVSSLTNYLTPVSENYEEGSSSYYSNQWLTDTDGTYGDNPSGIFFFTPDGKYLEYTGTYLYSDIPFEVADPVLKTKAGE